jgi:hypothetical protein
MLSQAPNFRSAITDNVEPREPKARKDTAEPILRYWRALIWALLCTCPRIEHDEPSVTISTTDTAALFLEAAAIDDINPSLAELRSETVDPSAQQSNMDSVADRRPVAKILNSLPTDAKARTLSELPQRAVPSVDSEDPCP